MRQSRNVIRLSAVLVAMLAPTDRVLAANQVPSEIDVDCVADRRDGVRLADVTKQTMHYRARAGRLYATIYENPFDTTSQEKGANFGWDIVMSTNEALIAVGYQMIAGTAASSEIFIIYRQRGEFRHVTMFDSPLGADYTKASIETGSCRPHGGL